MKKLSILLLFFTTSLFAQKYTDYELFQLKQFSGLKKMGLYVWEIDPVLVKEGVSEDSLNNYAKKILDAANINTVNFQDARRLEGSPSIEIELKIVKSDYSVNICVYTAVRFIQDVVLDRDRSIRNYSAITWERNTLFFAKDFELADKSINATKKMVNEFVKDFRQVNKN